MPRRGAAGERRSRRGEAAAERRGGGTETHSFCAGRLELSRRTVSIPRRVRLEDTARRLVRIAGGEALGVKHSRRGGGGGGGRRVGLAGRWRGASARWATRPVGGAVGRGLCELEELLQDWSKGRIGLREPKACG